MKIVSSVALLALLVLRHGVDAIKASSSVIRQLEDASKTDENEIRDRFLLAIQQQQPFDYTDTESVNPGTNTAADSDTTVNKSEGITGRIIGGEVVTDLSRYPYFAWLNVITTRGTYRYCGGSVIHSELVLTALHCVRDARQIDLAINFYSFATLTGNEEFRGTTEVRRHEDAVLLSETGGDRNENDLAILKLSSPVSVEPLQWATTDAPDGSPAMAMGFGSTEVGGPSVDELRDVMVTTVGFDDCNDGNSYRGTLLPDEMLCAGDPVLGGKVSRKPYWNNVVRWQCLVSKINTCVLTHKEFKPS